MGKRETVDEPDIPKEFKKMVWLLNNDAMPKPFEEKQWIQNVLVQFDGKAKITIFQFLDRLLSGKPGGRELQSVWHAGHPTYIMSDEHLRIFLIMISKALRPD